MVGKDNLWVDLGIHFEGEECEEYPGMFCVPDVPRCDEGDRRAIPLDGSGCTLSVCRRIDDTVYYEIEQPGAEPRVRVKGSYKEPEVVRFLGKHDFVRYRISFESAGGVSVSIKRPDRRLCDSYEIEPVLRES